MKNNRKYFLSIVVALFTIYSCNKETATYNSDQLTDYYLPLQPGKYITYRLDSLLFINYGTQDTVVSYLAKDVVDTSITDNLGRPSWRVIRYLSDTTGESWTPTLTYMVTATRETIEVLENNLRYQKLKLPITTGFSWLGNSYIDTSPINTDLVYLDGWNYIYDSLGSSYNVLAGNIPNTVIVQEQNQSDGGGSDSVYASVNFSQEVYAKGIGLIYRNTVNWIYQPPNIGTPVGSTTGFGIKMTMIDHN